MICVISVSDPGAEPGTSTPEPSKKNFGDFAAGVNQDRRA